MWTPLFYNNIIQLYVWCCYDLNKNKTLVRCKSIYNIIKCFMGRWNPFLRERRTEYYARLKCVSDTYTSLQRAFRVDSLPEPYYYCVSFKQLIHKIATLPRATGEPVDTLHRTHKCVQKLLPAPFNPILTCEK